jgi:hypothetical protein
MINEAAVSSFAQNYGDILGGLKTLEKGEELIHAYGANRGKRKPDMWGLVPVAYRELAPSPAAPSI